MTTINPVGSDNQQMSPAVAVGGAAVVGAGAGVAGKYFKPVDMESKDVLDLAKNKTAEDKKGFAKLIDEAKAKLFPKAEEGKEAPKATKFEELDDATKKALKEGGIDSAEKATQEAVEGASKKLTKQAESLTGEYTKMSDDAFKNMQQALTDAKKNLGKVVNNQGGLLKEGDGVADAMKALKESSDTNVKQMVEILEAADDVKLTDAQKSFVNGLKIDKLNIDDKTTAKDVRKVMANFNAGEYAKTVRTNADELADTAATQLDSVKNALKNDENFKNAIKGIARKQGIWKWAGIGAAALAVVTGAYMYFTKTDKTA